MTCCKGHTFCLNCGMSLPIKTLGTHSGWRQFVAFICTENSADSSLEMVVKVIGTDEEISQNPRVL